MNRIKVCILQNGLARGGTDTFVVNLCKGLDRQKFDITVVNPSTRPGSMVREPEILDTGAKIVHTSDLGKGHLSKFIHFIRLYKLLRTEKYDVFQTNVDLFNGPNLFVAWLAGVPVRCCHSHNGMQQKELVTGKTISIKFYQTLMRWMCWHFSNRRCGCSEIANNFLYKGYPWRTEPYPTIINNGIEIEKYRKNIDIKRKRFELGVSTKFIVLSIGRLIPQKNPVFIANSISKLLAKRNDIAFVWVSKGEMEDECRNIFQKNNVASQVYFIGYRDDVDEILKCVNLFYMPSVFEGLPIVLVEAQASGIPCLASDNISKEVDCGLVQFKTLNDSIDSWVTAIEDIIDEKSDLKLNEELMQRFSISRMVAQMEIVFEQ